MTRYLPWLTLALLVLAGLITPAVDARMVQSSPDDSGVIKDTASQPRAIIQRALDAMGAPKDLSELQVIDVTWTGTQNWGPTLSPSTVAPFHRTPVGFRAAKDFQRDEVFRESYWQYHGYERQVYRTFRREKTGFWTFSEGFGEGTYGSIDSTYGQDFSAIVRTHFLPAYLQALLHNDTATLVMEEHHEEASTHHIVLVTREGQPYASRFFFDKQTHLLTRLERPDLDPLQGTTVASVVFEKYKPIHGMVLPTQRRQHIGEDGTVEQSARYSFGQPLDGDLFEIPDKYFESVDRNTDAHLSTIAEGVYLAQISETLHMVFITFEDFTVAIHAPWSPVRTEEGLALAADLLEKKPLRYVGLAHHWWDASGGIRAFVSRGVPLIINQGHLDYYKRMSTADYSHTPDRQSKEKKEPVFRIINAQESLSDGTRELIMIPIKKAPEADEALLYYLPKERILISSAGFEGAYHEGKTTASDATMFLVEKIEALDLRVDTIVHLNAGTGRWEAVLESVRKRQLLTNEN